MPLLPIRNRPHSLPLLLSSSHYMVIIIENDRRRALIELVKRNLFQSVSPIAVRISLRFPRKTRHRMSDST